MVDKSSVKIVKSRLTPRAPKTDHTMKSLKTRKPLIGDVYEVPTKLGLCYIQYSHHEVCMGTLVRVLPGTYSVRPRDLRQLQDQERYFIYTALTQGIKDSFFHFLDNFPVPDRPRPYPIMRNPGGTIAGGKVLNWRIGYGDRLPNEIIRDVKELSPEELKLSIDALVAHYTLVHYLEIGWSPERAEEFQQAARMEQAKAQALEEERARAGGVPASQNDPNAGRMEYFLYFPKKKNADAAAERLRSKSMNVTVQRSADDEEWLVLAQSPNLAEKDDLDQIDDEMEALASEFNGVYDGSGMPLEPQ